MDALVFVTQGVGCVSCMCDRGIVTISLNTLGLYINAQTEMSQIEVKYCVVC